MATVTKPKPRKIVDRESKTKLDSLTKMPSLESLLVNVLNGIQNDIREQRTETKNDIREQRTETKNDIQEQRTETKNDIQEQRTETKNDIQELRTDNKWTLGIMVTLIAFVFMVMFFLHSDLKSEMKELKVDAKQNSESIYKIKESINQINQKLDKLLSK